MYKYVISTQSGDTLYKADPYGFWAEKRPGNASRVANIDKIGRASCRERV